MESEGKIQTTDFEDFKNIVKKGKYFGAVLILYDEDGGQIFKYSRNKGGNRIMKPIFDYMKEYFGIKKWARLSEN